MLIISRDIQFCDYTSFCLPSPHFTHVKKIERNVFKVIVNSGPKPTVAQNRLKYISVQKFVRSDEILVLTNLGTHEFLMQNRLGLISRIRI